MAAPSRSARSQSPSDLAAVQLQLNQREALMELAAGGWGPRLRLRRYARRGGCGGVAACRWALGLLGTALRPSEGRAVETVLIAEDEDLVRNVLVRILERAGYRVLSAAGGAAALKICREHDEIDLAVLDVVIPT